MVLPDEARSFIYKMSLDSSMVYPDFNMVFGKKKKKIFEHDGKIRAYDTVLVLKLINDIFYSLSLWPVQNIIKDSNKSIIAMAV